MANRVIVYGGRGALGSVCVKKFKACGWWVCNVDMASNDDADANVMVKPAAELSAQAEQVSKDVGVALSGSKVNAILCVAGGWAGGNAASADFIKNTELVLRQSVWTSVIASQLAAQNLTDGGLLQLTGAHPALGATAGMIGYGLAKAAVHQLTASLAADKSGLPAQASALAILPITLDTPMNRKFMPDADHSKWTPLEFVADTLFSWSTKQDGRPKSGSLVQLITEKGETKLVSN